MENRILRLRLVALFLFIIPTVAIIGSLLLNNYLVSFKFAPGQKLNFENNLPGSSVSLLCNEKNNYCHEIKLDKFDKLGQCIPYDYYSTFTYKDGSDANIKNPQVIEPPGARDSKIIKNLDKEIFMKFELGNDLISSCILNSKSKNYYNFFPIFYEIAYKIKTNKKTSFGTSYSVNPFIYGESSISNIVKRFPINYFFKPLLYMTVILMILYWVYYNNIIKNLVKSSKNFNFFTLGILSAIFLFLHVFFLGWTFESEFLTKLRRTFVVFFIFFEVIAQAFLIKKVFSIKDYIGNYLFSTVVYLKLFFVLAICSITLLILIILINFDLSPSVDYILEWNYFVILLFFYLLTFFMWKKLKLN